MRCKVAAATAAASDSCRRRCAAGGNKRGADGSAVAVMLRVVWPSACLEERRRVRGDGKESISKGARTGSFRVCLSHAVNIPKRIMGPSHRWTMTIYAQDRPI
eukprot:1156636-Pelagomonas_calceolata.AAC.11